MDEASGKTRPQDPDRFPDDMLSHERIMASLIRAREVAMARREAVEKAEEEARKAREAAAVEDGVGDADG